MTTENGTESLSFAPFLYPTPSTLPLTSVIFSPVRLPADPHRGEDRLAREAPLGPWPHLLPQLLEGHRPELHVQV